MVRNARREPRSGTTVRRYRRQNKERSMKRYFAAIGLFALGAVLVFEILQLFQARIESGYVYPPYSSLRSDPVGTMALFESLQAVPELSVERDLRASDVMPRSEGLTYLHIATPPEV